MHVTCAYMHITLLRLEKNRHRQLPKYGKEKLLIFWDKFNLTFKDRQQITVVMLSDILNI